MIIGKDYIVCQIIPLVRQTNKMADHCENNKKATKKDVNSNGENSQGQAGDGSVSNKSNNKTSLIETLCTEQHNLKRR